MTTTIIISMAVAVILAISLWAYFKSRQKDDDQPDVVPEPQPTPEPQPEPEPTPEPVPDPEPDPEPTPEPTPEPDLQPEHEPEPQPEPTPEPEPQTTDIEALAERMVEAFAAAVELPTTSGAFGYLKELLREADAQYNRDTSENGLPSLYRKENFPNIIDPYGTEKDETLAFDGLCGMLTALLLTELRPDKRNDILATGYNLGARRDVYIYRYEFHSDQNICRLVASVIYAAMRGVIRPDMDQMRKELGGKRYSIKVHDAANGYGKYRDMFFVDITRFMPTAPGPYLAKYSDRSPVGGEPYPNGPKTDVRNLPPDNQIYEKIVAEYNLGGAHHQEVVQAIADKEAAGIHMVGDNRKAGDYTFHPVYGVDTIGIRLPSEGRLPGDLYDVGMCGSLGRKPLLEGNYYGRRRPGESEVDGLSKDGAWGVLIDFIIENNDGNPCGYYDQAGNYVYGVEQKPGDYERYCRQNVFANSYPSGHSAYIWENMLFLVEMMPTIAHLLMRAACRFAVGRQITRYHWPSDTVIGRLIGAIMSPLVRATADYDTILAACKKEIGR